MGGRLAPSADELFSPAYAKNADRSDIWRNIFENPTTVQFNHRVLVSLSRLSSRFPSLRKSKATTTYIGSCLFFAASLPLAKRGVLPPLTRKLVATAFAAANIQVLLGISTLLYLVPIPLAAAHQAGSVALLTAMIAVMTSLRRPGNTARLWRTFYQNAKRTSSSS